MNKSASDGYLKRRGSPVNISHVVPSHFIRLGTAIERGSFGVVRRARWLRSIVAVKMLPTLKPYQKVAFLKEMSFACGLRHPNIVATMGAVTDSYCALIMELMPWGSLKASLNDPRRRQFFDFKKMIRGMMSICRGGAYLASVSVIHRDISSKNVFVTSGFESMKLGDFGYSSLVDEHARDREDPEYGSRLTDDQLVFAGAPAYKAPELLSRRPLYSEYSDVFAFAIVSWEMLTTLWAGTYGSPWSDIPAGHHDLNLAILSGKRPPLDPNLYRVPKHKREKHEPVIAVIKQCWDGNHRARPNFLRAHDMLDEVQKVATQAPVVAKDDDPTPSESDDKQDTSSPLSPAQLCQ